MLILDTTAKLLEVKLAGAVATTELPFVAGYVDINQSSFAMSAAAANDGITSGATPVTMVAAPGATTSRKLNFLSIVNIDTAAVTVTIQMDVSATKRIVFKTTLAVGDQLSFTDANGWIILDSNGSRKITSTIPANSITLAMFQQIGTASVLGRNTAGTGNVEVLTTLPTAVQDNITRLGTITAAGNVALLNAANIFTANQQTFINPVGGIGIMLRADATNENTVIDLRSNSGSILYARFTATPTVLTILPDGVCTLALGSGGSVWATLSATGVLTVNGFGTHGFIASGVGEQILQIRNTLAGTGNSATLYMGNDASAFAGRLSVFSSTYTTGTWDVQSGLGFQAALAGGLSLAATHASGIIRFFSGGTTERGQFTASGALHLSVGLQMTSWPTTGAAANAVLVDTDVLRRSTSSLRYKTDIERISLATAYRVINGLSPVTYRGINDGPSRFAGFIAEEVAKVEPLLVTRDKKRRPDYVTYDRISAYLVPIIRDYERRIAKLEERMN